MKESVPGGPKMVENPSPEQIQEAFKGIENDVNMRITKMGELDAEVSLSYFSNSTELQFH